MLPLKVTGTADSGLRDPDTNNVTRHPSSLHVDPTHRGLLSSPDAVSSTELHASLCTSSRFRLAEVTSRNFQKGKENSPRGNQQTCPSISLTLEPEATTIKRSAGGYPETRWALVPAVGGPLLDRRRTRIREHLASTWKEEEQRAARPAASRVHDRILSREGKGGLWGLGGGHMSSHERVLLFPLSPLSPPQSSSLASVTLSLPYLSNSSQTWGDSGGGQVSSRLTYGHLPPSD